MTASPAEDARWDPSRRIREWTLPAPGSPNLVTSLSGVKNSPIIALGGTFFDAARRRPAERTVLFDLAARRDIDVLDGDCRLVSPQPFARAWAWVRSTWRGDVLEIADALATLYSVAVPGVVERVAWAPRGDAVLLIAAGEGAERAGPAGSGSVLARERAGPVVRVAGRHGRRTAYVYSLSDRRLVAASPRELNVWEADWCGGRRLAFVASRGGTEDDWHDSQACVLDMGSGRLTIKLGGEGVVGVPRGSADGERLAFIAAPPGDRTLVAGDAVWCEVTGGEEHRLRVGFDVTHVEWRDDEHLVLFGLDGLRTVIAEVRVRDGSTRRLWSGSNSCSYGPHPSYPAGTVAADGAVVFLIESHARPPELCTLEGGRARTVRPASAGARPLHSLEQVEWTAPDGLGLEGLLARPDTAPPHRLVVALHGGPHFSWRDRWLLGDPLVPLLAEAGYGVFLPNPRGSAGRGAEFAALVYGDAGGADAFDVLSGIAALTERGLAERPVGLYGASYGGYLACRLPLLSPSVSAVVAVSPVTDWAFQNRVSNCRRLGELLVGEAARALTPRSFERSPAYATQREAPPTLILAGDADRCTPAGQARVLHGSLRHRGCTSELVLYPGQGHGLRSHPALADVAQRSIEWFGRFSAA